MAQPTESQIVAAQAVYTRSMLSVYDFGVLGVSNRFIWKCPSDRILAHYNQHVSSIHLDVGVGTGYFLDRCAFPSASPRVALMDMNPNTLAFTSRRIARYQPETYRQNILEKIEKSIAPFDSVGMNYLLHCVPGAIADKAVAFDHIQTLMNPGATLFGSTILGRGTKVNWVGRKLMALYNSRGIFNNSEDDLAALDLALKQRFKDVSLTVIGCVVLFSARF